ncbi:MAG: NAD kinase [Actinomycetaceae bacterium]|nr:NAD kinase [Actinomycetaceae bacterium]
MARKVAMLWNDHQDAARESALKMQRSLEEYGVETTFLENEDAQFVDLIVVFGGDGTVLYAAERARSWGIPILGINYGHVGFLTEADPEDIDNVVDSIAKARWYKEPRMTIDVGIHYADGHVEHAWALNEAVVSKADGAHVLVADMGVEGKAVSSFRADSVIFSTSTGSTAYNFSAGGPVVWPDVECMVMTPVAAHALFTRPLVVGPYSQLELQVREYDAMLHCDGRRSLHVPAGAAVTALKGDQPVWLARLSNTPFSGRLITKFDLPVEGWRDKKDRQ